MPELKTAIKELEALLNEHKAISDKTGVKKLQSALKGLQGLLKEADPANSEALALLDRGKRRLFTYANSYVEYLGHSGLEAQKQEKAKIILSSIIESLFEMSTKEEFESNIAQLFIMLKKKDSSTQFYYVLMNIEVDTVRHIALKIFHRELIESLGIEQMYAEFSKHTDKDIRSNIAEAILSCAGVDDAIAKQIEELSDVQLTHLASVLNTEKAIQCIDTNKYISDDRKKNIKEQLKLQKLQRNVQVHLGALIADLSGTPSRKSIEHSQKQADKLQLQIQELKQSANQQMLQVALKLAEDKAKISLYSATENVAIKLKKLVTEQLDLAVWLKSSSMLGVLAQGETLMEHKQNIVEVISHCISILYEIDGSDLENKIGKLFHILMEKKNEETYSECIEIAHAIALKQPSQNARFQCSKVLLTEYSAQLSIKQIDTLIEGLVRSKVSENEIYQIVTDIKNPNVKKMLVGRILKNSAMRNWLLSSNQAAFKLIMAELQRDFIEQERPAINAIMDREARIKVIKLYKQNRSNRAAAAKELFSAWTLEDYDKAVKLTEDTRELTWLRWGILTTEQARRFTSEQLKSEVGKLDVSLLSPEQIRALDIQSRAALLRYSGSWKERSKDYVVTKANGEQRFSANVAALLDGFTAQNIAELGDSEIALLLMFKKFPNEITTHLIKSLPASISICWSILREIEQGVYKNSHESWLGDKSWLHQLIVASFYSYDRSKTSLVINELTPASFITRDILMYPDEVITSPATSADMFKLILQSPYVINQYHGKSNVTHQLLSYVSTSAPKNYLDAFIMAAASERGVKPQPISPKDFLTAISSLQESKNNENQKAAKVLKDSIPLFIKSNAAKKRQDVQSLKALCDLYRKHNTSEVVADSYKQDPLVAALESNPSRASRQVLGYVLFSHHFIRKDSDHSEPVLLEGYLSSKRGYKVPEPLLLSWFKTFVWGLTVGAAIGLVAGIYRGLSHNFNPLNWLRTRSLASQLIDLAKLVLGLAASGGVLFGIGATGGGLLAAIAAGAIVCGVGFVTGRAAWQSLTHGTSQLGKWLRGLMGGEVLKEGQADYDIIRSGLSSMQPAAFKELITDPDHAGLAENLCKNILYLKDNGFDISGDVGVSKEIRAMLLIISEDYYNKHKYDAYPVIGRGLLFAENILTTVISLAVNPTRLILMAVPWILSLGTVKFNTNPILVPPWLRQLESEMIYRPKKQDGVLVKAALTSKKNGRVPDPHVSPQTQEPGTVARLLSVSLSREESRQSIAPDHGTPIRHTTLHSRAVPARPGVAAKSGNAELKKAAGPKTTT